LADFPNPRLPCDTRGLVHRPVFAGFQPFPTFGTALVILLASPRKSAGGINSQGSRESDMFNFANLDLHRIATAAIGALVLSTACVGAAVAPAGAFSIRPAPSAQA
jgi:hypothetical protein